MCRKDKTVFRLSLLLYLAAVAILCFGRFTSLPNVSESFLGIPTDKIAHFLMFLPFPLLAFLSFGQFTRKPLHSLLLSIGLFLAGCLIAAATEAGQALTGYRTPDALDFKADVLAIGLGSIAVLIIDLGRQFKTNINR